DTAFSNCASVPPSMLRVSRRATGSRKNMARNRTGSSPTRTGPCSPRRTGMCHAPWAFLADPDGISSLPVDHVKLTAAPADTQGFAAAEQTKVPLERPPQHHPTASVEPDRILDGIAYIDHVLDGACGDVIGSVSIFEPRGGLGPQYETHFGANWSG